MKQNDKPIGIFDSGLGGLTVFKEVRKTLPKESLIYFGDTAHVPYGSKSVKTITKYSMDIAKFLELKKIKALIVACNSASSAALTALKKNIKVPVIDVITSGAEEALRLTKNNRIAVIGTKATISSNAYAKKIKILNKKVFVYQKACPILVPLAEEGWWKNEITYAAVKKYLTELKSKKVDTLILGCTHYPIIEAVIQDVVGNKIKLVNSAKAVSKKIKKMLSEAAVLKTNYSIKTSFYVSDSPDEFKVFAQKILKKEIKTPTLKHLNG